MMMCCVPMNPLTHAGADADPPQQHPGIHEADNPGGSHT